MCLNLRRHSFFPQNLGDKCLFSQILGIHGNFSLFYFLIIDLKFVPSKLGRENSATVPKKVGDILLCTLRCYN